MISRSLIPLFIMGVVTVHGALADDAAKPFGLKVETYAGAADGVKLKTCTHIAFGPGGQEIITDLKHNRLLYRAKTGDDWRVSPVPMKGQHSVAYNPKDGLYYVNDTENDRIISFADLGKKELTVETKTMDDLVTGNWTDLSSLVPNGMTPYYLTVNEGNLYLAIFNHESPENGDSILQLTPFQNLGLLGKSLYTQSISVHALRTYSYRNFYHGRTWQIVILPQ